MRQGYTPTQRKKKRFHTLLMKGVWVPVWELARRAAPQMPSPASGTIYVSGTSPAVLPAGNDTTGTGSAVSPYATLTKALSMVPAGGDYLIRADGTFAENNSGRWILAGNFAAPVVVDSYSADAANFIITNASGTNGVVGVRGSLAAKIYVRRATIRSSTDNNRLFYNLPTGAGTVASDVRFFDCVFEGRTSNSVTIGCIGLPSDFGINGLYFVRCQFKKVNGTNTTYLPQIADTNGLTTTINNQPNVDIGFWDCSTTDANWLGFMPASTGFYGISKLTYVRNTFLVTGNYGLGCGKDAAADTTPKCTNIYIYGNAITCVGANPHGMVVGSNCTAAADPTDTDGITVKANTVNTGLQGIVIKGAAKAVVEKNNVTINATVSIGSALYAKASTGCKFRNNTVVINGASFACIGFREDLDGSTKSGATTFSNNTISATGANAQALLWAGPAGSTGDAVANDNDITLSSGASLGSVRGTTVVNQTALRAVWAAQGLSGDDPTNDSRSIVL